MTIIVCSLAELAPQIAEHEPDRIISLLSPSDAFPMRPDYGLDRHLHVAVDDIIEQWPGYRAPEPQHVEAILRFAQAWQADAPMIVHCWAGISRSTATAFTIACARNPQADEEAIAWSLRNASPTATPNARLVALADAALGRAGRMRRAIAAIGRGEIAERAQPFAIASTY